MKESNNIENIFRDKLYNMEVKPSVGGWEALEHTMVLRKKRRTLRGYYMASGVAAALLAAALIIGSLTNNDIAVEQLITENIPQQTQTQTIKQNVTERAVETFEKVKKREKVESIKANVAVAKVQTDNAVAEVKQDNPIAVVAITETPKSVDTDTTQSSESTKKVVTNAKTNSYNTQKHREYMAQEAAMGDKKTRSRWSADIATSGSMLASNNATNGSVNALSRYALTEVSALSSTKGDISSAKMNHKLPISVGFTAKYNILPRLSVETGIMYSYLESDSELKAAADYRRIQQLHYIGVPLNISYQFAKISKIEFYTSIGGMAEWLVDGNSVTTISKDSHQISKKRNDIEESSPLWSANFGVGVGYNFIKHLGIFVEPGVSYYFENTSQPMSYKTENQFSFNLRLGLRATF